jgi:hypothetical protein
MSENIKEKEPETSFSNQSPEEAFELKSETIPSFDFGGQSNKASESVNQAAILSRMKESAARLRHRLYRGRGIL